MAGTHSGTWPKTPHRVRATKPPFAKYISATLRQEAGLAIPALMVHGRRDPFFPVGNGEALAREIPGARLLVLEGAATAIPDVAVDEVAAAMLER
jgi:pimeloyl-ACP methyl ester carboxylesterase